MENNLRKHLSYANGYRQLGMFADAHEELEKIDPDFRHRKEVLVSSLAISSDEKDWQSVARLSQALAEQYPGEVEWRVQWAYALRRCESLEAAKAILETAILEFPTEPCLHYNLGCYACVEGEIDEAKTWISRAFTLESDYRKMALEDEDLEKISDWIEQLPL